MAKNPGALERHAWNSGRSIWVSLVCLQKLCQLHNFKGHLQMDLAQIWLKLDHRFGKKYYKLLDQLVKRQLRKLCVSFFALKDKIQT